MLQDYIEQQAICDSTPCLSFRGAVAGGADAAISHEHYGARWVSAADTLALLTDESIAALSAGNDQVAALLRHIRADLERHLAKVA